MSSPGGGGGGTEEHYIVETRSPDEATILRLKWICDRVLLRAFLNTWDNFF